MSREKKKKGIRKECQEGRERKRERDRERWGELSS